MKHKSRRALKIEKEGNRKKGKRIAQKKRKKGTNSANSANVALESPIFPIFALLQKNKTETRVERAKQD